MKTQQQAQEIFNVLVKELSAANSWNLFYVTRHLKNWRNGFTIDTPREHFLKSVREKLTVDDVSDEFLNQVYAEAFHTGLLPQHRNYMVMTCDLQVNSGPISPVLRFWVDLDKLAAELNAHLQMNPPYRFTVQQRGSSARSGGGATGAADVMKNTSTAFNIVQNSRAMSANFLMRCFASVLVGGLALLVIAFAVVTLSHLGLVGGILTAIGIGLVAGGVSHGFFKASAQDSRIKHTSMDAFSPVNIEEVFKKHFAQTIDRAIPFDEHVEIIDEPQVFRI
jgi:hypothetical protein